MKLYPAIDILGGNAVRLVKGDFDAKKVYDEDPLSAARGWVEAGAAHLHVVDLDGAQAGEPVNLEHLRRIAAESGVPVQFGGGLRTPQAVDEALARRRRAGDPRHRRVHRSRRCCATRSTRTGPIGCSSRWTCAAGTSRRTAGFRRTDVRARDAFAGLREQGVRNFVFTNIDHDGMLDGANREEVASGSQARRARAR